ncbi:MAG: 1-(5-phosphoribosyl)-5-[(5-phosphoribosylamino)methylideneamino]imidazole-4-carboxamide isomerase [Bacillota bacterium]|nr:1-(5-phosphoribosyl)-5-[(5-phosphoribosylamino)methylideneamino]imidazole-4-carboxamide isomerase [Bacillota bacterium]
MQVIPALDLRQGRCVRLVQGERQREMVFSRDPVAVALDFAARGAQRLHVVDLDAAFGESTNRQVIREIVRQVSVPVQMGGGVRDLRGVEEALALGVQWVILGTAAVERPELVAEACRLFPGRILVGIDARQGYVCTSGWTVTTPVRAEELARRMGEAGVEAVIYTDIARDGTLSGPNLEGIRRLAEEGGVKVIASGGISSARDIAALRALEPAGVVGVVVGRALYSGSLTLEEALKAAAGREEA